MIEAGRYTSSLSDDSKLKPDLGLLTYLHSAGRTQTHKWLAQNLASVGRRETVDFTDRFLADRGPVSDEEGAVEADDAEAVASKRA